MAKPSRSRSKAITKKHLARLEREQLQTRYILISTVAVVLMVIVLISYGILDQNVFKPHRTVAKVGGSSIPLNEFQANVRYRNIDYVQNFSQIAQYFGDDSSFRPQYQNAIDNLGKSVQESLVEDRLIRQEAKRRNIKVTKDEVDKAMQTKLGYFPDGTPTPKPTSSPVPTQATSTLSPLQLTLVPYTPTPAATQTSLLPPTQSVVTPTATLAPTTVPLTVTQTVTPTATAVSTATPGPSSTPSPTSTPFTLDAYKKLYQDYTKFYGNNQIPESDFRRITESQLYREKVQAALLADSQAIPAEQEYIWARHILVSSEITATEIISQLNQGEDFVKLAGQYSIDPGTQTSGGDLGWFPHGQMVLEFDQVAFALANIGDFTQPVKSSYGFHIIQLLGRENRPFASDQEKFQYWLYQQKQSVKISTSTDLELLKYLPAIIPLPTAQAQPTQTIPEIIITPQEVGTPTP
jgi:parvulin-like peptidyl-prolyl isomerase